MVNDQPNMRELEMMINFCRSHKNILIYGCAENQVLLSKYLKMIGIPAAGFVVTVRRHFERWIEEMPVYELHELQSHNLSSDDTGFLLALPAAYYNDVLCNLQRIGYKHLFYMSEYNKQSIAYKMRPRTKEQFWLEVNLADHCNLNCQMCDHFAPLAKPTFLDLDSYKRDLTRLADLTCGNIGIMKLQGGEPLLNENLIEFIKVTRELLPKSIIFLFTDGLLLKQWEHHPRGNLWQACHDYDVWIQLTVYPINIKLDEIRKLAEKYDVHLDCFAEVADRNFQGAKRSVKHPFDLDGKVEPWQFISCYQFNESIVLKDGKIYTCPMIPYIGHFNSYFGTDLQVTENDYIDIYKAKDYEEIAEFVTHRTDFCRYCKVKNRRSFEWKQSAHTVEEYVDFE